MIYAFPRCKIERIRTNHTLLFDCKRLRQATKFGPTINQSIGPVKPGPLERDNRLLHNLKSKALIQSHTTVLSFLNLRCSYRILGTAPMQLILFSAFWLRSSRSSVVCVLISLISNMWVISSPQYLSYILILDRQTLFTYSEFYSLSTNRFTTRSYQTDFFEPS